MTILSDNFRISKTLKRYIFSYLCILVVPLLIVSLFVYNYVLDVLSEEVLTNNLHTLQRAQGIIETQMGYILSLENQVYLESNLSPFFLEEDTLRAMEIQRELFNYLRINPYLYDMAYYQADDDYMVTALSSCQKEQFFNKMYRYEDWNYAEFVKDLKERNGSFLKGISQVVTADGQKKRIVTVVQPLGRAPQSRCMLYLIDSDFLTNILPDSDENSASAVLTAEGEMIASAGDESLIREALPDFLSQKDKDATQIQEGDNLVSYICSEKTEWIYLSLVPGASIVDKVGRVRFLISIMLFFVLTGGGMGAYLFAKSNYAPIRDLEEYTNSILENKESASEIDHIANVLEYLNQQNKILSEDNELRVDALQKLFIDRFLSGWYEDEEQIRKSAEKAGICFEKKFYRVVLFYLYRFPAEAELSVEDAFYNSAPREINLWIKMKPEEKKVVVIAGYDPPSEDKLETYLVNMVNLLQGDMQIKSISSLGKQTEELMRVSVSFKEAVCALEYRIVLYQQKLIRYEEVALRGNDGFKQSPKNLKKFIENRDIDGMEGFLNAALNEICWKKTNINRILRQCNDLILSVQETIEEVNREFFTDNPLYEDISGIIKYEDCHELIEIIRLIGYDIIDRLNVLSGNTTIEAMLLYIQENAFSCDFSTAAMAERFKMSLPYLSQYFKNHMGVNLLDYVTERKMEKAKELLKDTRLPIRDIAVSVGYYNVNSFQRRFKQVVGYTPGEYRKL